MTEEELGRFVKGGNVTERQAWGYVAIMVTVAARARHADAHGVAAP